MFSTSKQLECHPIHIFHKFNTKTSAVKNSFQAFIFDTDGFCGQDRILRQNFKLKMNYMLQYLKKERKKERKKEKERQTDRQTEKKKERIITKICPCNNCM